VTDIGPVSRFVRGMPGFQLRVVVGGGKMVYLVLACGPQKADGSHDHFQVAPGFDRTRPRFT